MDANHIIQMATVGITTFRTAMNEGHTLCEFEHLAYEQGCRAYETIMRDFRKIWEKQQNELGENTE